MHLRQMLFNYHLFPSVLTFLYLKLSTNFLCSAEAASELVSVVQVFHLIDNSLWGEADGSALQGNFQCPRFDDSLVRCDFHSSDTRRDFLESITAKYKAFVSKEGANVRKITTVSMYNIHTWGILTAFPHYPSCLLPTDLSMVESEESLKRFKRLFAGSFPLYDGNSTTSPWASVQRTYIARLNESLFLPLRPHYEAIVGAAFVASTCHRGGGTTNREEVVTELATSIRVDGLGKCKKTHRNDAITLKSGSTAQETLLLKQKAISHYLFYLAFENTKEPGYVTEKVMDALIAGVVPVYLGDTDTCRKLLPHPKAAIFLDDFSSVSKLADYLLYLTRNATAYEEHRAWRSDFNGDNQSSLFSMSWPCAVCHWALKTKKIKESNEKELSTRNACV